MFLKLYAKFCSLESKYNIKFSPNIKTPTKATQFSVGLDIYSPRDYILTPQSQLIISTGLRIKVPYGYYGHLC